MKKSFALGALAAAVYLLSPAANAGTVFTGTPKTGQHTVNLNDTSSKMCRELASAGTTYNYAESQDRDGMVVLKGCWTSYDDKVVIQWSRGDGSTFTANWTWDAFSFTSYGERKYNSQSDSKRNAGSQL
jgi:hypothetical protein